MESYDALLIVSFGGPEGPDEVLPFLENVTGGRNIPRERLLAVAEHYQHFGGVSPINSQVRALIHSLVEQLNALGPQLPVYWGNRNWHPFLADAMQQMADDGIIRALAFLTSAYSSYSGCRQYLEDIERARAAVGPGAPAVDRIRAYYNHPGFLQPMADRVRAALEEVPKDRRAEAPLVFTAHSIPAAMAAGCRYEAQLHEACRLVAAMAGHDRWSLVWQSRSGPPQQPWLEPDICDYLRQQHGEQAPSDVLIAPIGFISDHLEVLWDLDFEARAVCDELGIRMVRAGTVGNDPRFVEMIRRLALERMTPNPQRLAMGGEGPAHDVCPVDCCPSGRPIGPAA